MASLANIQLQYRYALQDQANLLETVAQAGLSAQDTLTLTILPTNGQTVTIDAKVYTFKTVLDALDGTVLIDPGNSIPSTLDNLMRAITLGLGAGVVYGSNTIQHPTVTASDGAGNTLIATAKTPGTTGNSIAVSTNVTGGSWATPTLTGGSNLTADVQAKAVAQAIQEYSRRFFRIETILMTGVQSGYYPVPADWLRGFSRIVAIEFPIDVNPPTYIAPKSWRIIPKDTGLFIFVAGVTGTFRLTYTTKHDETNPTTIPVEHEGPLGKWAAMIACQSFMALYANTTKNNVDSINYRTKEEEWRHVHDTLRHQLNQELMAHEMHLQTEAEPIYYFKSWDI
jgi:hypothetical protein